MTITPDQMRAAGRELRLRREGESPSQGRPFGQVTEETLERFASGPTPAEVTEMKRELVLRDAGLAERRVNRGADTSRPFEEAQTKTLRGHVKRTE